MTHSDTPLRFEPGGLIPAVIQDADSGDVLMVGFMNEEALAATRRTGKVHFWSRGRGKLWRKGETSGHEQLVEEILVNCELNSLLVKVRQIGAVCHDGYPSCYYRRLEEDGTLTVIREREFDPAEVYGEQKHDPVALTRRWYGAYEYLRANDLSNQSRTSRLLRAGGVPPYRRIGDELIELAGVLDGTHVHDERETDTVLEGSQVLYWIAVNAIARGCTWEDLRPDRALATGSTDMPCAAASRLLRAEAVFWAGDRSDDELGAARFHAAIALVAQAFRSARVEPRRLIEADLDDLVTRTYLSPYFGETAP